MAMAMLPALHAQDDETGGSTTEKSKFPKNGVRFVICSPTDQHVPSPLYVRVGREYLPVVITSRTPTPRLKPDGGVIKFYEKPPVKKDSNDKTEEQPYITVTIPKDSGHKCICIVQPSQKGDTTPKTYFLPESDFKKGGIHVINFTSTPLRMVVDPTGEFDGKEKKFNISPRPKDAGSKLSTSDSNVWSYMGKGMSENVSFILQTSPTAQNSEGTRIRAGVFMTMNDASQISIVVKHPTLPHAFRMLSVQCSEASDKGTDGGNQ